MTGDERKRSLLFRVGGTVLLLAVAFDIFNKRRNGGA